MGALEVRIKAEFPDEKIETQIDREFKKFIGDCLDENSYLIETYLSWSQDADKNTGHVILVAQIKLPSELASPLCGKCHKWVADKNGTIARINRICNQETRQEGDK